MSAPNPYHPSPADLIKDLEASIIEELSQLGDVEVVGFITPVKSDYLLDNVKAKISPKGMTVTTVLDVEWDSTEKVVRYKKDGRQFTPPRRTYEADVKEDAQDPAPPVVDRVMNRMRQVAVERAKPVVAKRNGFANFERNYLLLLIGLSLGAGVLAHILVFHHIPWFFGIPLDLFVAGIFLIVIGGVFYEATENFMKERDKKAGQKWSETRSQLFYDVFDDDAERVEFLTYLVDLCDQKNIAFGGNPKVRYDKAEASTYNSQVEDPVVEFQTAARHGANPRTVIFNGEALYYYTAPYDKGDKVKIERI